MIWGFTPGMWLGRRTFLGRLNEMKREQSKQSVGWRAAHQRSQSVIIVMMKNEWQLKWEKGRGSFQSRSFLQDNISLRQNKDWFLAKTFSKIAYTLPSIEWKNLTDCIINSSVAVRVSLAAKHKKESRQCKVVALRLPRWVYSGLKEWSIRPCCVAPA